MMTAAERDRLIDELLDDVITKEDFHRLEEVLHSEKGARQAYYERLRLHTALELATEEGLPAQVLGFPPQRRPFRFRGLKAAAAIAMLGGAITLGWFSGRQHETDKVPLALTDEPIARGFAVVSEQSNAIWKEHAGLSTGELIPPGRLELSSGTIQLDLFSGVTLIVEGNTAFEIQSAMEMRLHHGKIRALVPPPAQGFRVRTTTGDLVDLGTEFALDVQEDHADFRVLDGEIEWHPHNEAMETFRGGQAMRWSRSLGGRDLPFESAEFDRISKLSQGLATRRQERRQAWAQAMEPLTNDPRVLAYFPMAQASPWDRRLAGSGPHQRQGTIVSAHRVADRWGHANAALDFSPTGSRVRVNIPGTHHALTLYCWAKIDSLDRWYNSLFLTDGHELNEPHWQIMNDGRLFFSVKAHEKVGRGNPDKHICFSPPFWSPSLSGQWIQLATTFDCTTKEVVHYLNGSPLSRETVPDDMLVEFIKIGAASIGNWSEPKRHDPLFAVRNLNGSIDELILFNAALNPDEIAELYQTGKP